MSVSSGMGFSRLTALVPNLDGSELRAARMVTPFGLGTRPGAVYKPEEVMVPLAASPPTMPFTDQIKPPVDDPEPSFTALNCWVSLARTDAVDGVTATPSVTGGGTGLLPGSFAEPDPTLAQPVNRSSKIAKLRAATAR
jgi:hypothetical protein